jgi:hypothetical protein
MRNKDNSQRDTKTTDNEDKDRSQEKHKLAKLNEIKADASRYLSIILPTYN